MIFLPPRYLITLTPSTIALSLSKSSQYLEAPKQRLPLSFDITQQASSHSTKPVTMPARTLAFFGATGDCAGYCLANALKSGYDCVALARTPAKLTQSMKDKGVPSEALDQHLKIVPGDVKDIEAVKKALQLNGKVVDTIISGIGPTPKFQWSLTAPISLGDLTICQSATRTILRALTDLQAVDKPLLLNVSTTGIWPTGAPRDIPLVYTLLYRWFLHVPHEDKRAMGKELANHLALPESERGIRAYVTVKPTLLMSGDNKGLDAVRYGVEEKPAIGYTIRRSDVGLFMFERMVKTGLEDAWLNESVTLTY